MKNPTDSGMNKTGIDMSPKDVKALIEGVQQSKATSNGEGSKVLASMRAPYIKNADPIGNVPVPGTFKGAAKTGMQKLMAKKPEVLIEKLGARLAFERTGTRLYEALIEKCEARTEEVLNIPLNQLREFRNEEAQHFALVRDAMKTLGADPTAVTPEADLNGVASIGLMQILSDPRTTVAQSIHAIHIAELADYDGWGLLIALADQFGQDEMASDFRKALAEEERHLATIRELMKTSCMSEAGVG
jgi:rubrerythrin